MPELETGSAGEAPHAAPTATRHDLQLGRRFFHAANGCAIAAGYGLLFTHQQVVHVFGTIACLVYVLDRVRIAYPEVVAKYVPQVNHLFLRAEEQIREAAMTPFAIAVLLTILSVPKLAALIAILTLGLADPAAAVVGIRFGRRKITKNRSLEGSLAFFVTTASISIVVLGLATTAPPSWVVGAGFWIALGAAGFELLPLRIDDNLTIPLFVGFFAWIVTAVFGIPLR